MILNSKSGVVDKKERTLLCLLFTQAQQYKSMEALCLEVVKGGCFECRMKFVKNRGGFDELIRFYLFFFIHEENRLIKANTNGIATINAIK